ncbi:hypothetical protein [Pannonibacter carbonis]|nr:hypothetical protein [Pannonibacter carbonis]
MGRRSSADQSDGEWSHSTRFFANDHVVIERGAVAAKLWFPE